LGSLTVCLNQLFSICSFLPLFPGQIKAPIFLCKIYFLLKHIHNIGDSIVFFDNLISDFTLN
jgi:hypothetical protein